MKPFEAQVRQVPRPALPLGSRQVLYVIRACLRLALLELVQTPANLVSIIPNVTSLATYLQHFVPCAKSIDSPGFQPLIVQLDKLFPFQVFEVICILMQSQGSEPRWNILQ